MASRWRTLLCGIAIFAVGSLPALGMTVLVKHASSRDRCCRRLTAIDGRTEFTGQTAPRFSGDSRMGPPDEGLM